METLFGTDGIRGKANVGALAPDTVVRIGVAVGMLAGQTTKSPRVVIGKDTRESGYMIEAALVAGLTSVGANPILLGPLPTPGTSWMTRSMRADLGIMITASHNPYWDNGLKMFDANGCKISDQMQSEIEALVASGKTEPHEEKDTQIGRASRIDIAHARYMEAVKQTIPRSLRLAGTKIVLDCAHGAAYRSAPDVLWELGAEVITMGDTPNGQNINLGCGATDTAAMRARVISEGADIGIALDGDGDRVIICDENGQVVDGDQILCTIAEEKCCRNSLARNSVAATIMSNIGLDDHLAQLGISVTRTAVGDRQLAQAMYNKGLTLGGEPSGHIILRDYACTGDGLVAALQVLAAREESELDCSRLCHRFDPVPQLHRTIALTQLSDDVLDHETVRATMQRLEASLESRGRMIVRKSGTEPLIRIMVETRDHDTGTELADELTHVIEKEAA